MLNHAILVNVLKITKFFENLKLFFCSYKSLCIFNAVFRIALELLDNLNY